MRAGSFDDEQCTASKLPSELDSGQFGDGTREAAQSHADSPLSIRESIHQLENEKLSLGSSGVSRPGKRELSHERDETSTFLHKETGDRQRDQD